MGPKTVTPYRRKAFYLSDATGGREGAPNREDYLRWDPDEEETDTRDAPEKGEVQ